MVVADLDDAGRRHARVVAASLEGVAASVRLVAPAGGNDATDHLAAGFGLGEFVTLEPAEQENTGQDLDQAIEKLAASPSVVAVENIIPLLVGLEPVALDAAILRVYTAAKDIGILKSSIRGQVERARGESRSDGSDMQGQALALTDPEPWPESVDGAEMLDELAETFSRFLALPEGAADMEALWSVHACALDTAEVSPILALTSPLPECGKTTNLEILSALVPRPLPTSNLTPATVFRAVDRFRPSLLVDEGDTFLRDDELRGILNSGHRRALAYVVRCVGDDYEPRLFSTWACKAIALIGKLPPTLRGRSIEVRMQRRKKGEDIEPLRRDWLHKLEPLRRKAWRWAQDHRDALRGADPDLPDGLHDRAADNWRPLFAIADLAGAPWPERVRAAIIALGLEAEEDDSAGVLLLGDLKRFYEERQADKLSTVDILTEIVKLEGRPWLEWGRQKKPISATVLANLLGPFKVRPKVLRMGSATPRGYLRADFVDAWERYVPGDTPPQGATPATSAEPRGNPGSPGCNIWPDVAGGESGENPRHTGDVAGVAPWNGDAEKKGPRELILGSDATAEERGVEYVCPGCRGGMGAGDLQCETCQYVTDDRIGLQGQAR
jgi:putative DNA primase/helicase